MHATVLNTEIAAALHIEESTVKTHVKRLLAKLQARDRVEAVLIAQANAPAQAPGDAAVSSPARTAWRLGGA